MLVLVEPSFTKKYYKIVSEQHDYLAKWLVWPPLATSEAFFLSFIEKARLEYSQGKGMVCAMIYQGELVGNVALMNIDNDLKVGEIGYWISQTYQGKGIITRSVSKLIDVSFTEFDLDKIRIKACVENTPSRQVCERLNILLEGITPKNENLHGIMVAHAVYGLSKKEQ